MGGYGSGGHNQKRGKAEYYPRLDSFIFGKVQKPQKDIKISFGTTSNNIRASAFEDGVRLCYSVSKEGEDIKDVDDYIYFSYCNNNYGGKPRVYFICPYCSGQVRMIYLRNYHFMCRKCGNLNYNSQQATKDEMLVFYRARKLLNNKLKHKGDIAPADLTSLRIKKPKYMHYRTYYKHMKKYNQLVREYDIKYFMKAMAIVQSGLDKVKHFFK